MYRIVIISDVLRGGGAEKMALNLFDGLRAAGHDARLFCDGHGGISAPDHTHIINPSVRTVFRSRKQLLSVYEGVLKDIHEFNPDIVHVHNIHNSLIPLNFPFILNQSYPVAWTFHDLWPVTGGCCLPMDCPNFPFSCTHSCLMDDKGRSFQSRGTVAIQFQKLKSLWQTPIQPHVIAPSRWMQKEVRRSAIGRTIKKCSVIPNGIEQNLYDRVQASNPRKELNLKEDIPVILLVASSFSIPVKGSNDALEILRQLGLDSLNSNYSVIWLGRDSDKMVERSHDFCDSCAIPYTTSKDRVASVFAAADIFLMPSHYENFPTTILEAMVAECTVVARRVGGVGEQVIHENDGFLFETVHQAVRVLCELLNDIHRCHSIGEAARRKAQRMYSLASFVQSHLCLYEKIVHDFRPVSSDIALSPDSWDYLREIQAEDERIREETWRHIETERKRAQQEEGRNRKWHQLQKNHVIARLSLLLTENGKDIRIAIYGAGQHTRWLLKLISRLPEKPNIVLIIDDYATQDQYLSGFPVVRPEKINNNVDVIIPSSDTHETDIVERCRSVYGDKYQLWPLYEVEIPVPCPKT